MEGRVPPALVALDFSCLGQEAPLLWVQVALPVLLSASLTERLNCCWAGGAAGAGPSLSGGWGPESGSGSGPWSPGSNGRCPRWLGRAMRWWGAR